MDFPTEAPALAEAGASEVYCGLRGAGATRSSTNRRDNPLCNLDGEKQLRELVKMAHGSNLRVQFALNTFYDEQSLGVAMQQALRAQDAGVDGVIVADLGLLRSLETSRFPLPLTLSCLGVVYNTEAIKFYLRFPIRRIVLPRHVTLREMARLCVAYPELEFEAFVFHDRCPFEDGFCNLAHEIPGSLQTRLLATHAAKAAMRLVPDRLRHAAGRPALACLHARSIERKQGKGMDERGRPLEEKVREVLAEHDVYAACALCDIPLLVRIGIRYLKIVNRGSTTTRKTQTIRLIRSALTRQGDEGFKRDSDHARESCLEYRRVFGRNCGPRTCYYPPDSPRHAW